jgi:DNA ligase (NAD+)
MTKNIKAILREAATAYYEGNPTMSDKEFDRLAQVAEFDEVGFNSRDNRTPHAFPMYSLQKVFTNEVESNPLNDYKGATMVSPKLDGAAVSLLYIDGKLHRALTRGDGIKGLDITELMQHLVPSFLVPHATLQQITGEVVAPKSIKNARNYAAGALNLKDENEFKTRDLRFIAYGVQPAMSKTLSEDLAMLSHQGFSNVIESNWSEYPDDGVVFKIDNYIDFEKRGYTSHHPRGAFALKSIQTGVNTKLLDVIWNVGKSGVVAPTAILEPIEIDGANVSRATLHNMRYITDLNLEIGCTVEVIRSGEIIPKIVRRVD